MSEKAAATYWYGMALAKLVAESELNVPWLAHVDRMSAAGALATSSGSGGERGDLVGRGPNGDWHVIEAKGRTNSYPQALITKAKGQSAKVISVNGQPPATTSACIASLRTQPISILVDDPPPNPDKTEKWSIEELGFFRTYYEGVIGYVREFGAERRQTVGNLVFLTAPLFPFFFHIPRPPDFPEWRLELGILAEIYQTPEMAPEAARDIPHEGNGKVGRDGIALFGRMPDWEVPA